MSRLCLIGLFVLLIACEGKKQKKTDKLEIKEVTLGTEISTGYPEKLSEWGLFKEPMKSLTPEPGIIPYDLNTPLFSDYAHKSRFVKIPKGESANYQSSEVMDFPKGTILIKNFYYPLDFSEPTGERKIMETRLLINKAREWEALTYIWNEGQTEAFLELAGANVSVSWTDEHGDLKSVNYSVPNQVQCKSCHELNGKLMPIGPTARQLNRAYNYSGQTLNQIKKWEKAGMLTGVPAMEQWPLIPVWDDPKTGSISERARAWLEINCAHCHREAGPAKNTGLYLTYDEADPYKLGLMKPPVAAGRGSGGLKYGVVPGQPKASILYYRIKSLDPGVMMPEVGRKMNHDEGIELVKEWISEM